MSVRVRIVALAAGAVAIAVVIALVASYFAIRGELVGQLDDALRGQARVVAGGARIGRIGDGIRRPPRGPGRLAIERADDLGPQLQLVAPDGSTSAIGQPTDTAIPVPREALSVARIGRGLTFTEVTAPSGVHYRVATAGAGRNGAVMVARDLTGVDQVLRSLRIVLGMLILAGIAIAGGLGFLVARNISRPIVELSDAADTISRTNDLSKRIDVDRDDEIGSLANNFNRMLEALEASVASQRQLVADASHELRTPVAAVRTDIETLIQHPELPVAERGRVLNEATESLSELSELINDVIELARGEEQSGEIEPIRLDLIAADSIARFRRLAPDRVIEEALTECVVDGRSDRISRAINNLIDNAIKYSPPASPIEVTVQDGTVAVLDRGPGVAAADREHIFDRFWRGSGAMQVPGSGLGLAIVQQVANTHGGTCSVEDREGGGSRFALTLPVAD